MKLYKLKRKIKNFGKVLLTFICFPYIWLTAILILLGIISLINSIYFDSINENLYSSIFGNIFAGLITGIIILLITNIKTIEKMRIEFKKEKLNVIRNMIFKYSKHLRKIMFQKNVTEEESYNHLYDAICYANDVNVEIRYCISNALFGIDFEKYFIKNFDFDINVQEERCLEIREYIIYNSDDQYYNKEAFNKLRDYENTLTTLNSKLLNKISEFDFKINVINKSII